MPSGYANRVLRFDFPELSQDPETDPVWVITRNPMTADPKELTSAFAGVDLADRQAVQAANASLIAKLVIAARAYDATVEPSYDPLTGEVTGNADQPLLPPPPWTPESAAKLPTAIQAKIIAAYTEAVNPSMAQPGNGTPKTSSSPPSLSTTAPGAAGTSPPS